ncbi:coniferyl-alcohol dehydrogenase [Microbacterium sp. P02]|uniref:coniferyl-alcohol dehydrogenase n=1 Tax=Microbacterium sp. P02 TaxID=3366260 RepID=UPI0036727BCB
MTFADYRGTRVVVTGCSSGVGEAAARALVDLGAEVFGLSRRRPTFPIAQFHSVDLASVDSVDHATSLLSGPVDALFNCAGAPPTLSSREILKVNFLGPRLLTERVIEIMPPGGAIANVSSSVAGAWRDHLPVIREFVDTPSYDSGLAWYEEHEKIAGHGYPFSKQALTVWTLQQSSVLVKRGLRINAASPGQVDTALLEVSQQAFPPELLVASLRPSGRASTVQEQVLPLLFLNSRGASYVNGADLAVDGGNSAIQATEVRAG